MSNRRPHPVPEQHLTRRIRLAHALDTNDVPLVVGDVVKYSAEFLNWFPDLIEMGIITHFSIACEASSKRNEPFQYKAPEVLWATGRQRTADSTFLELVIQAPSSEDEQQ